MHAHLRIISEYLILFYTNLLVLSITNYWLDELNAEIEIAILLYNWNPSICVILKMYSGHRKNSHCHNNNPDFQKNQYCFHVKIFDLNFSKIK